MAVTLGLRCQSATRMGPTLWMTTMVLGLTAEKFLMRSSPFFHRVRLLRSPTLPSTLMKPSPAAAFAKTMAVALGWATRALA